MLNKLRLFQNFSFLKSYLRFQFIKISAVICIFILPVSLSASDEPVHNGQMLNVLFGRPFTISRTEQQKTEILEKAVFLCVDLFNGYNIHYLTDLNNYGVQNLPSAQYIDFSSNYTHQRATHRGWDFKNYSNQAMWEERKKLLLFSIDRLFDFQETEMIKRDSFAALLYYVHIIGDHIGNSKRTLPDRMRINGSMRGRNMERLDVVWELEYHIPRLFRGQESAVEYKLLMKAMQRFSTQPPFDYSTAISDDDYSKLQGFAVNILNCLTENIPALLRNESFFRRAFP